MKRRNDLQGLRAVAVLVVALGHAGVGFLGGGYVGVDVFFVLSGFLITGLLLDEARRTGAVSLAGFYTRRARRILPAAALTLVATELAAYFLLNFVRARQVMWDSVWAAFFGANVHFSRIETDYFARDRPPSPIQHFWTLAVEEQFYLVWPALLGLVLFGALLLRRRRVAVTPASTRRLLGVLLLATAASLAWSVAETSRLPTAAYFSTFARAWELGLGAALAVVAGSVAALRAELRAAAGWLGFGAIALASTTFSSTTAFPGYAALLPTLGAALVIAGGTGGQPAYGVGRLLSVAPMRWVGDRSYTLYLWHWPILILAMEYAGHRLSLAQNLALLTGAVAVSALTFRFYENPLRRSRRSGWTVARLAGVAVASSVLVAVLALGAIRAREGRLEAVALAAQPRVLAAVPSGAVLPAVVRAAALGESDAPIPPGLQPSVGKLAEAFYMPPAGCAAADGETSSRLCRLGRPGAARTIAVLGDSHSRMWMPAILALARHDGWAVVPLEKDTCGLTQWGLPTAECDTWFRWALRQVESLRPQVTLVAGRYSGHYGTGPILGPRTLAGMRRLVAALGPTPTQVVLVEDPPGVASDPVNCLLGRHATTRTCTTTFADADLEADRAISDRLASLGRVELLPTRGWFCAGNTCPLVVGDTIAYLDTNHVTVPYVTELAASFRVAFAHALEAARAPRDPGRPPS